MGVIEYMESSSECFDVEYFVLSEEQKMTTNYVSFKVGDEVVVSLYGKGKVTMIE